MKGLLFLVMSILTVTLITSGGNAFASDGGFCHSVNPSAGMC